MNEEQKHAALIDQVNSVMTETFYLLNHSSERTSYEAIHHAVFCVAEILEGLLAPVEQDLSSEFRESVE